MTTATHRELPVSKNRILFASLLAAIGLLAASCGGSDRDSGIARDTLEQEPATSIRDNTSDANPDSTPPTALNPTSTAIPPTASSSIPLSQSGSVVDIAAGDYHTCVIHQTGLASCWGDHTYSKLGTNMDLASTPQQVRELESVTDIVAGANHTCALHEDGTVSCWGSNSYGQLGVGLGILETHLSSTPTPVKGLKNATAITSGLNHLCALRQDGSVSCWGHNKNGQIGLSESHETDEIRAPFEVPGITDATAIAAGGNHACALHPDGNVSCWGAVPFALSNPNADSSTPLLIEGISNVIAITAGGGWETGFTCALHEDRTTSCWGNRYWAYPREDWWDEFPATISKHAGIDDAVAIEAGRSHVCVIKQTGSIACSGSNDSGQLGRGFTSENESEMAEVIGIDGATNLALGASHSCALRDGTTLSCWGSNGAGQLGVGTVGYFSTEQRKVNTDIEAAMVSAGYNHSCMLRKGYVMPNSGNGDSDILANGYVSCWGSNDNEQFNDSYYITYDYPETIEGVKDAAAVSAGGSHACALNGDGTVICWGNNSSNQLGRIIGDLGSTRATLVADITAAISVDAGGSHTCAVLTDKTISCWGSNNTGQLGNGEGSENSSSARPVRVLGIADAAAVSAGASHSCALHENGSISCWGENGPLGTDLESNSATASSDQINFTTQSGSATRRQHLSLAAEQPSLTRQIDSYTTVPPPPVFTSEPIAVPDIEDAIAVSAGGSHTCALRRDSTVACWGSNRYGQLGNGDSGNDADTTHPVKVAGIDDAIAVSAGSWNTCALHKDRSISCWGENYWGESGWNARGRIQPTAVKVGNISDAIAVSAGGDHVCALHEDATVSCWGDNAKGKLGLGINGNVSVLPITVL